MLRRIIPIATGLMFGGCSPAPPAAHEAQATEAVRKAEAKTSEESRQREQAEARLHAQEKRISLWQIATLLAVSAAGFALIIGTILGSSARKEADEADP